MDTVNADIIIVGDTDTGKTNLMLRFITAKFAENSGRATYIDFKSRTVPLGEKFVRLKIWDTAGSERFRAPMRPYYRKAYGVIVVYDITRRETFKNLPSWLDEIKEYCTERKPVILLCGLKLDQDPKREVSYTEAVMFAAKHEMLHCETSAKTGKNVDFCFLQLGAKILERPDLCSNLTNGTPIVGRKKTKNDSCC
ncbi:ras-related protein Rab-4B [Galendromus occidentalis]|uniref:Ras-related protein Rab-4B n=1 Tax=Galendromus occidentalis TaxID=34638 RepID=A0AAJ6QR84_9ACAR|nr:ras-related protein Rab-4B [Galendromus occidentalis]